MALTHLYGNRILSVEEGQTYQSQGWKAADLHVHSSCSYDVLPAPELHPEAIYQTARDKGLPYVTITDHDTMDAYDIIGWQREGLTPGVEITLRDEIRVGHTIHVNVYELNKNQFLELKSITDNDRNIETFVSYLKDQNLPFTYNHPFWFVPRDQPNYKAVEEIIHFFPVIEYNMKRVRLKNWLTLWLAAKYHKGVVAATDTHIGRIAEAYTLSQGNTFREFFDNISIGNAFLVPQDLTLLSLHNEIVTWIDLLLNRSRDRQALSHVTGIALVDRVIEMLSHRTREKHPRAFPALEFFFHLLARTHFFSFCYLQSQNHKAKKICRLLEIPELAL